MRTWPTPPLGSLVHTIVPARDKPEDLTGPIPWLRIEDIDGKYLELSQTAQGVSNETIRRMNLRVFPAGTVVCSCSCDMGTTAIVARPLITNQTFIGLLPRSSRVSAEFLYYSLQAHRPQLNAQATGAVQAYLSRDDFRSLRLPMPDAATQRSIAAYLDAETARINALVEKKRRLIALVTARFAATRLRAVAGDAPDWRQRRTGPQWLGTVPEHWALEKLTYLARMESGHTPNRQIPEYWENCTIPWVTLNDVGLLEESEEFYEPRNQISELGISNSSARVLPARTVILSRDATVGRAVLLGEPMAISQHFVGWICGPRLLPEYLLEVLRGPLQGLFAALSFGSTISTIGMPELRELVVPVPSISDQRAIVTRVRRLQAVVRQTTALLTVQIDLLAERREALISAAVTGELDVTKAAA